MDHVQEIGSYALALAVVVAVILLTWHGSITGEAAIGLLGGVAGVGVGIGATKTGATISRQ